MVTITFLYTLIQSQSIGLSTTAPAATVGTGQPIVVSPQAASIQTGGSVSEGQHSEHKHSGGIVGALFGDIDHVQSNFTEGNTQKKASDILKENVS